MGLVVPELVEKGDQWNMSRPINLGVMLDFFHRIPSSNGVVWNDGSKLESNRIVLGRWAPGSTTPSVRTLLPKEVTRTVSKHQRMYSLLVDYHKKYLN